jgi:Mrp family chromosome partitioning ATPase
MSAASVKNSPDWSGPVEQILLVLRQQGTRIVGITSPTAGAGVSTLSRKLASGAAQANYKILLLALNGGSDAKTPLWRPAIGEAANPVQTAAGYHLVAADSSEGQRQLFNNVDNLRRGLHDFKDFEFVFLDLPPILGDARVNPVAAATACDGIVLVCLANRVTANEVTSAEAILKSAGARTIGAVLNDAVNPSLDHELGRYTSKFTWRSRKMPRSSNRVSETV